MRTRNILAVSFLCLVSFILITSTGFAQRGDSGKGGGANRPASVIVEAVRADTFADTIKAVGTLKANESIALTSSVTETVTAVNFTDGQRVNKGDVLVEMTSGEERALVGQQKSILEEARRQLSRAKALHKQGAVSGSTLDQRQRDFSSAEQSMMALQSRLKDYIILAPFNGVIGISDVSVGALLQPGTRIATLDDDSVMKLDFTVPSVFLPVLSSGLTIKATSKGFDTDFTGVISAIDSQINETTRSILVRSRIDNPDGVLKPGLLMNVTVETQKRDALVISEMALIPEGEKNFVFLIDESQTPPISRKTEVRIGSRRTGEVEILEGLKQGDKIVIYGTMSARDATPVTIQAVRKAGETLQDILKRVAISANPQASPPQKPRKD